MIDFRMIRVDLYAMSTATAKKSRLPLFCKGPTVPSFSAWGVCFSVPGLVCGVSAFNASGHRAFWFQPSTYIPVSRCCCRTGTTRLIRPRFSPKSRHGHPSSTATRAPCMPRLSPAPTHLGLRVHVFEEGHMRPFWVAYERDGSNGNSRLMNTSRVLRCKRHSERSDLEAPMPPSHWGGMRQHVFCGALYHWFVMFRTRPLSPLPDPPRSASDQRIRALCEASPVDAGARH